MVKRMITHFMAAFYNTLQHFMIFFDCSILPHNKKSNFNIQLIQLIEYDWNDDIKV